MSESPALTRAETWLVLNCYGTLLVMLALVLAAAAVGFASSAHLGALPTALALVPAAAAGIWGLRITARLPTKIRVFRTTLKRIERKGFAVHYFETLCREPCMRQVTWLALKRSGHAHHYREIVSRYSKNATFHLEHSNPVIEDLILSGALPEHQVREAVEAMLRQVEAPRR